MVVKSNVVIISLAVLVVLVTVWAIVMTVFWVDCDKNNSDDSVEQACNTLINVDMPSTYMATCSALTPTNTPSGYTAVPYGHRVSGGHVGSVKNTTLDACASACDANDKCTGFAYDVDTQLCTQVAYSGISSSDVGESNYAKASFYKTEESE